MATGTGEVDEEAVGVRQTEGAEEVEEGWGRGAFSERCSAWGTGAGWGLAWLSAAGLDPLGAAD